MQGKNEITSMQWKSWSELDELRAEMLQIHGIKIHFTNKPLSQEQIEQLQNTDKLPVDEELREAKPEFWSQQFAPNIFIGERAAVYSHYGILGSKKETSAHDYSLIFDFSGKALEYKNQMAIKATYHTIYQITDEDQSFDSIIKVIEQDDIINKIAEKAKSGKVLICCSAGISRSVIVSMLYLMHTQDMRAIEAYRHLFNIRPKISPNIGLFFALLDYETQNNKSLQLIQFELYKKWLHDYVTNPQCSLDFKTLGSEQITITINEKDNLFEKVIDFTSFLTVLQIPFESVVFKNAAKLTDGKFIVGKEDYAKMQLVLTTKTLPPVNDDKVLWGEFIESHKDAYDTIIEEREFLYDPDEQQELRDKALAQESIAEENPKAAKNKKIQAALGELDAISDPEAPLAKAMRFLLKQQQQGTSAKSPASEKLFPIADAIFTNAADKAIAKMPLGNRKTALTKIREQFHNAPEEKKKELAQEFANILKKPSKFKPKFFDGGEKSKAAFYTHLTTSGVDKQVIDALKNGNFFTAPPAKSLG